MKHFLLILMFSSCFVVVRSQELMKGSDLPKAVFYKTDGKTFTTEQISKGKKSLIMFFDATCGHCQKVAAELSKRSKELGHIDLYMVTLDEQTSINYFMTKYGKPLMAMKNVTVLQDKDHVFLPLFHPKQYPALYLYGQDKKLVYWSSNDKDLPKFLTLIKN